MRYATSTFVALMSLFLNVTPAIAQAPTEPPEPATAGTLLSAPSEGPRLRVFISDLHFGVGRKFDGAWHPTEDFRWPRALAGFLTEISRRGNDKTDLIIVGDFLEMWQPSEAIKCKGLTADLGCTLDEMTQLAGLIAEQHKKSLADMRAFGERGDNRIYIIPGNHDSSLRYKKVWQPIADRLNAASGRINLVEAGIWTSPDRAIVAEHGHQIGLDVNRYDRWPRVVKTVDGIDYVIRPWGELFVQRLFNEQEEQYPIIDNLSPESAGARYRAADRGFWGSASDIARLLFFNLLETSPRQQSVMLGAGAVARREWNTAVARKLGADLFIKALDPQDPLAIALRPDDPEANAIKAQLTVLAQDKDRLPDEEVMHLCDLLADRKLGHLCTIPQAGALAQHLLVAKAKVLGRHLSERQKTFGPMRLFIYGHTHQFELPWQVKVGLAQVTVVNSGAFQRLVDEAGFLKRLNGMTPEEGLRKISLEQLAPCYSAVLVKPTNAGEVPAAEILAWFMPEDGVGELISSMDPRCR